MPELDFFIGKGGVGKTTVSAAYAIRAAHTNPDREVLLISTDPAHSLSDVLQTPLKDSPRRLRPGRAQLVAWEMNAEKLFREFLAANKKDLVETIERGSFFSAEEISSLLDTTLPGMSEISALLALQDAIDSAKYSRIVIDTAPFGHTMRLFDLPRVFLLFLHFLETAADRDRVLAQHFGGTAIDRGREFIDAWRHKMQALQSALTGANIFLVTTAEKFALNESVRCVAELRRSNPELKLNTIVLNRVITRPFHCSVCRKRADAAREAKAILKRQFPSITIRAGEDSSSPILGSDGLMKFAQSVFDRKPLQACSFPAEKERSSTKFARVSWPILQTRLSFVMGKGGVGKTTISAGLGFHSRQNSENAVEICSVDPAPSLDDVFQIAVEDRPRSVLGDRGFRASEVDSLALFRHWIAEIRAAVEDATSSETSGVHVDLSFERKLFSDLLEIVPPGLDEVLAISRIVELLGVDQHKVVVDMAPTGHALELLRTPERILAWSRLLLKSLASHRKLALAREAAVKIAELEVRARELSAALKNSKEAQILVVMLPEPLPDRETERLVRDLDSLNLSVSAIFVNRVLSVEDVPDCARCRMAAKGQARIIAGMKKKFRGKKIYFIPEFEDEIAGQRGLKHLTKELWRLQ